MMAVWLALSMSVVWVLSGFAGSVKPDGWAFPIDQTLHSIALPPASWEKIGELSHTEVSWNKGPLQIGVGRVLDQTLVVDGGGGSSNGWLQLYDGSSFWSLDLTSPGALGIRLHLQELRLPAPVELVVYGASNPTGPRVSLLGADVAGTGDLWTDTVFSEHLMLEIRVPAGIDASQVHFKLAELSHLYRLPIGLSLKEGGCYSDVTCYPEWADAANSVARITYVAGKNTYLCTGCLLASANGTNRADYFLAARHCITSQTLASTIEFFWLYQTAECNGTPPDISTAPHTAGGGLILASGVPSDFCFMRLRQPAPAGVTRANWTTQLPSAGEQVVTIHHPDGTFKRISAGNLAGSNPYFWGVQWFSGATEGGSSGAPLFNANHELIGHLTGGFNGPGSSCDNPSALDQFGRFDITYAKIRRWLGGSGGIGSGAIPKGTYNGLFFDQDGGAHVWNSGFITFSTSTNGAFSGKLLAGALRRSFTGLFDSDLHAQLVVLRGKEAPWIVQLQIAQDNPTVLSGSVSDGNWTVQLLGNYAFAGSKTNVAAQAGHYNLVIPGNPVSGATPGGDSFGTVAVDRSGRVRLIGSLADDSKVTQATGISTNGDWPFYASGSSGHSLLIGWFNIADNGSTDISGNVAWLKEQSGTTVCYPDGFEMNEAVLGSRYTPPTRGAKILNLSQGTASFAGGGLTDAFSSTISMNDKSRIQDLSGNHLNISFSPGRGTFTGHVQDPASSQTISFSGVVLQKQNGASGFFSSTNQTGQVLIQPSS